MADDFKNVLEQVQILIEEIEKGREAAQKARSEGDLKKAIKIDKYVDNLHERLKKMPTGQEYVDMLNTVKSKPINMADEVPYQKGTKTAEAINQMQKVGKLKKAASEIGKRVAKAAPYVGTGLGLIAAKEALKKGDKVGAALETASAFDPTPISDIILAGKDIYDIAREPSSKEETETPTIADPKAIENVKKMLGEKEEIDPEEQYSSYENYIKKQRKKLGYE